MRGRPLLLVWVAACGTRPAAQEPCIGGTFVAYADQDRDGFGDPAVSREVCTLPDGFASRPLDCDDTRHDVHQRATEVCNGIDDDCDGLVDFDDPDLSDEERTVFYADHDGDGFGDPHTPVHACEPAPATVHNAGDCDDADPDIGGGVYWRAADHTLTPVGDAFQKGTEANPHVFVAPGDGTLLVCPGTYYTRITGAGDLRVVGPAGPAHTTLRSGYDPDLGFSPPLFAQPGGRTITLDGLTIHAGGIVLDVADQDVALSNLVLDDVMAIPVSELAAALQVEGGTLTMSNVTIRNSWSSTSLVRSSGEATLTQVHIEDSQAFEAARFEGPVSLSDVTILRNWVHVGLALEQDGTIERITVEDAVFGVHVGGEGATIALDDATIRHTEVGLAVIGRANEITLANSVVERNGYDISGGGAYLGGTLNELVLVDTLVSDNRGLHGVGVEVSADGNTLTCRATQPGFGILANEASGHGGGILVSFNHYDGTHQDLGSTVLIEGCDLGAGGSNDDNTPHDLVTEDAWYECPTKQDCTLVKQTHTPYTLGKRATFCLGPACNPRP